MRYSIIASALLATLVAAGPINKRAEVVEVDMITNTVIVTSTKGGAGPAATVAPAPTGAVFAEKLATPGGAAPKPAAAPASTAPAAPAGAAPATSDYEGTVLYHHNQHRANHSAPALTWDTSLATAAQQIAETCQFGHVMNEDGLSYGQNIANGNTAAEVGKTISDQFYNGEEPQFASSDYGLPNPVASNFETTGHFTQIVWAGTKTVGCFTAPCAGQAGGAYTVCNYGPAGNVGGQYGSNVARPEGHPTLTG